MTADIPFAWQGRKRVTFWANRRLRRPPTPPVRAACLNRRELLLGACTAGLATVANRCYAQAAEQPADHTIRIAPLSLEIGPNKVIRTTGYNGTVPGPPLRLKEGTPVTIKVDNDSGYPNLIHWHGLSSHPFRMAQWRKVRRSSRRGSR